MRDDPIVYEDWQVGFSSYFTYNKTKYIDFGVSILISLINLIFGITTRISSMIFSWIFVIMILVLIEGVFEQMNRTIWDRSIIFVGLILTYFITTPRLATFSQFYSNPIYHISLGILFSVKLVLIPISESTINLAENILIPKNDKVQDTLDEQISRLESTIYEIDNQNDFDLSLKQLRSMIIQPFLISFAFISIIALALFIQNQVVEVLVTPLLILIMLLNGVALSVVLLVGILEKQKNSKKIEEKMDQNN